MKLEKLAPWNWFKKEEEQEGAALTVRRTPSAPLYRDPFRAIHDEIDRVFGAFMGGLGLPGLASGRDLDTSAALSWLRPSLDLAASEDEYSLTVELPGVEADDVQLEVAGDTLLVRGEKKHEKKESKKSFYRMERSYGAFQRMLSLPGDADPDGIDAEFKSGVLRVRIPRKPAPASHSQSIEIKRS